LLLGAYQALARQIGKGAVRMYPRTEMLDLVVIGGRARGIVCRDLVSGKITQNKDFGSGYRYPVILEDAKVTVEKN
jgi:hypothetical protein